MRGGILLGKNLFVTTMFFIGSAFASEQAINLTPRDFSRARCFLFEVENPQRMQLFEPSTVTGCYIKKSESIQISFLKDDEGPKKETTVRLYLKNGKPQKLTHYSLSQGELKKVSQDPVTVNPLPIPLTLEQALENHSEREVRDLSLYSDSVRKKSNSILKDMNIATSSSVMVGDLNKAFSILSPSEYYLPEEKQPKDGYWWPHSGYPLANGTHSPMAKYDAYVESVTGVNPGAQDWEIRNHYSDTNWAGHCNGWASSTILYGYLDRYVKDQTTGFTITSSDIQGLRAASAFCVLSTYIGSRYSEPEDDISDIYPQVFFKNLFYYLKYLQKPIVMDYKSGAPVDNHIISGYNLKYQPTEDPNKFLVTPQIRVHQYNMNFVRSKKVARIYTATYPYYIWLDKSGRVLRAQWVDPTNHPDFMWVPLAQSNCSGENPYIDPEMINHMVDNLPALTHEERAAYDEIFAPQPEEDDSTEDETPEESEETEGEGLGV